MVTLIILIIMVIAPWFNYLSDEQRLKILFMGPLLIGAIGGLVESVINLIKGRKECES